VGKKRRPDKASGKRELADQLAAVLLEQQRLAVAIESLTATVHLRSRPTAGLEEIRKVLDDVLIAQHRTNKLLELALRAGFDEDERIRS
jgi:hypothetical protein